MFTRYCLCSIKNSTKFRFIIASLVSSLKPLSKAITFGTTYSRMDQAKFVEGSL